MPASLYQPQLGEIVHDLAHKDAVGNPAEGVYMDTLGALVYLRLERGGCEWTTRPEHVRPSGSPRLVPVQHPSRPRTRDAA
ncbi:hypothetical protein P3T27_002882 [Kitasatospora sp. MAA19]|uniref:hypothetical protein n=1 Tax=unclassified Kitasatospora TaxID=2633591 RepID=UPI002475D4FD|nr:hypothetical protein [Kitasatospora sp. MAA19]MDH6706159.1 hypothetical protein [Kitasatospora sp. MAA19]